MDWQTNLLSSGYTSEFLNNLSTRGFTGHEMVDSVGIIHMNGRIYDPMLGRFLQADPVVQASKHTQSLNRYTYALNNLLSFTDPSGYSGISSFFKKYWRVVVAAVVSYFTFGVAYTWALTTLANAAAAGTFMAGLTTIKAIAGVVAEAISGAIGQNHF